MTLVKMSTYARSGRLGLLLALALLAAGLGTAPAEDASAGTADTPCDVFTEELKVARFANNVRAVALFQMVRELRVDLDIEAASDPTPRSIDERKADMSLFLGTLRELRNAIGTLKAALDAARDIQRGILSDLDMYYTIADTLEAAREHAHEAARTISRASEHLNAYQTVLDAGTATPDPDGVPNDFDALAAGALYKIHLALNALEAGELCP